jgi:sporulation protein YlmC with PRC-barrel domain
VNDATPSTSPDDFRLGTEVRSSDGRTIGKLHRVLVGGADYGLKALVIKEGHEFSGHLLSPGSMLLADELVVPREAVKEVSRNGIELHLAAGAVRRLHPYLSYRYEAESAGEELSDLGSALGASPSIPGSLEEVAHKPASELEIEAGENVMLGRTGRKLGEVKDVLFDGQDLVGVVLLPQGLLRHEVILPRRFLQRSDDLALFAQLSEEDLEHLEPFRPDD